MNRPLLIAIGCLAAAGVLLGVRQISQGPPDVVQIKQAVDEAVEASREGRPGPVLDFVSRSLTVNADMVGGERGEISKFIRNYKPNVEVLNFTPQIRGDEAVLTSPVRLSLKVLTFETDQTVPDVTLRFRRETAFRYLIIPSSRWRLSDISAPNLLEGLPPGLPQTP